MCELVREQLGKVLKKAGFGENTPFMGWAGGTCGQPIGEKFRYHVRYPPPPLIPCNSRPERGEACFCRFLFLQRTRDKGDIRRSIAKYNITEIARATLDSHTHTTHNERTSASGERS